MLVSADTSALSNLAIIGRIRALQAQFGEVICPNAVAFRGRCEKCSRAINARAPGAVDGGVKNSKLLRLAEPEFDLFITSDQNIRYQQVQRPRQRLLPGPQHVLTQEVCRRNRRHG